MRTFFSVFFPNYRTFLFKSVHFYHFSDIDYLDTWKEMEKLVDLGLVKSIGVSNFNSKQMDRLLSNCRIKPVANQVGQFSACAK